MARRSLKSVILSGSIVSLCLFVPASLGSFGLSDSGQAQTASSEKKNEVYPRGMKLILTDGTFQLVREYQRNGERVRYYSLERGAWEELPAVMVDWIATAKAQVEMEKESTALVEKVHKQEQARRIDNVMDIDASLQVGDGAFLPSGEGMFLVEGKSIRILDQTGAANKTDNKRVIADVLSPVHMVPGKQTIELQGTRALVRLKSSHPEFYLREAPPDPDAPSSIQKSRRPGDSGPDVALVRTKVGRKNRQLESISTLFREAVKENVNEISMQRWEVAPNVYRFTLSQSLPPGEYVLAEILGDGLNLYVWDFGVDAAAGTASK